VRTGFIEVLRVVEHHDGQAQDDGEPMEQARRHLVRSVVAL
jgi:hypothetical protein